jgi:hypothetical protein
MALKAILESSIEQSAVFNQYKVKFMLDGVPKEVPVTYFLKRPANFFFADMGLRVTPPSRTPELFAITDIDTSELKLLRKNTVSAKASAWDFTQFCVPYKNMFNKTGCNMVNVAERDVYGPGEFKLSCEEIMDIINDQNIYLCPSLSYDDYINLKVLLKDYITIYEDKNSPISGYKLNIGVQLQPYDFGTMVVKKDNFWVFVDDDGHIMNRDPGSKDCLKLISACGIRSFARSFGDGSGFQKICNLMYDTFQTIFKACGKDSVLVMSAIGMGVWKGRGVCYWRSFLHAVMRAKIIPKAILINPAHQPHFHDDVFKDLQYTAPKTPENGEEFKEYLELFWDRIRNPNLKRIRIMDKDIVSVARNLRSSLDQTIDVCILNASDPDVTLGNHVGEYVNNVPHTSTTEENFAAIGTSGLCWEWLGNPIQNGRVHESHPEESAWFSEPIRFGEPHFGETPEERYHNDMFLEGL